MILPIVLNENPILRKKCKTISSTYPLGCLIMDMFMTMWEKKGIGLAAPQIGKSIRLFVIDTTRVIGNRNGIRRAFINAHITDSSTEECFSEEGCLSLPGTIVNVRRKSSITLKYHDENFEVHTEKFHGIEARVIQHELDHTEGKLITDYATTP